MSRYPTIDAMAAQAAREADGQISVRTGKRDPWSHEAKNIWLTCIAATHTSPAKFYHDNRPISRAQAAQLLAEVNSTNHASAK